MKCNIGIIGTGRIAQRFVDMLKKYYSEEVCIFGIFNPNINSANSFAKNNNVEYATDIIENLLSNNNLDIDGNKAVYIASPHETHYEYAKRALEAGFNVLCEKPITLKYNQTVELFEIADRNSLVLMEGIKTAYCPGFKQILEVAKGGIIGDIVDVEATFTRIGPTDSREYWDENYGGSFFEFGRYPMLPVYELIESLQNEANSDISFHSIIADTVMDKYTKTILSWKDKNGLEKCMATIKTGLGVKSEGELIISGTCGYIQVPSPWWLTKRFVVRFENPGKVMEYTAQYEDSGLQYEMNEFLNRITHRLGNNESEKNQSIWCSNIFEKFSNYINNVKQTDGYLYRTSKNKADASKIGIWAHRGCSMVYPENTLLSFEEAAKLNGIKGIEFDVQYTKDRQLVVFHDETLDRVTNGKGNLRDYTLKELKQLLIWNQECIPTLDEVLQLLKPYCIDRGLLLNIELKTSVFRYDGIEQMTVDTVRKHGLEDYIIYSSFLSDSISEIKRIDSCAKTGMLAVNVSDCISLGNPVNADALHPCSAGMDIKVDSGSTVRMWNSSEPLYGSGRQLKEKNLLRFGKIGVTDIFTNVPELYLQGQ